MSYCLAMAETIWSSREIARGLGSPRERIENSAHRRVLCNQIQPESADQIGTRKVENVLSVSPELLVSGNPGCTLQIQAKLRDRGLTLPALHPIELLDLSIRGESPPGH